MYLFIWENQKPFLSPCNSILAINMYNFLAVCSLLLRFLSFMRLSSLIFSWQFPLRKIENINDVNKNITKIMSSQYVSRGCLKLTSRISEAIVWELIPGTCNWDLIQNAVSCCLLHQRLYYLLNSTECSWSPQKRKTYSI